MWAPHIPGHIAAEAGDAVRLQWPDGHAPAQRPHQQAEAFQDRARRRTESLSVPSRTCRAPAGHPGKAGVSRSGGCSDWLKDLLACAELPRDIREKLVSWNHTQDYEQTTYQDYGARLGGGQYEKVWDLGEPPAPCCHRASPAGLCHETTCLDSPVVNTQTWEMSVCASGQSQKFPHSGPFLLSSLRRRGGAMAHAALGCAFRC